MKRILSLIFVAGLVCSAIGADPLIAEGSKWQYWDKGGTPGEKWTEKDFDDTGWKVGEARLGYGGDGEKTTVDFGADGQSKHITTYFRQSFAIDDKAAIKKLKIRLLRDDGAVVYLNGKEILRSNMAPGKVEPGVLASATVSAADEKSFIEATVPADALENGKNVIAVEVHQAAPTSTDLGFDLEIKADESKE